MGNVLSVYPFEDDGSSPTSNDRKTALEADGESEGQGLPISINESGMDLAPIGNLCGLVNENLRNFPMPTCKDSQLQLELDRRIGFASCWKLSCSSCDKLDSSAVNRINYLKRKRDASTD